MTLVDLLAQDLFQWMDDAPVGMPRRVLLQNCGHLPC